MLGCSLAKVRVDEVRGIDLAQSVSIVAVDRLAEMRQS